MPILALFLRLLAYAALLAATFGATYYNVSQGALKDNYFSEVPQNVLLLLIILLPAGLAYRYRTGRAFLVCVALFFLACLVREFDNELDALLFFGAWKIPALSVGALLAYYIYRRWGHLQTDVLALGDSIAMGVFGLGWVLLMVFSRLWGGNGMWRYLMPGDTFNRTLVRVSEEGIELMAYTVIFIGVLELALKVRAVNSVRVMRA